MFGLVQPEPAGIHFIPLWMKSENVLLPLPDLTPLTHQSDKSLLSTSFISALLFHLPFAFFSDPRQIISPLNSHPHQIPSPFLRTNFLSLFPGFCNLLLLLFIMYVIGCHDVDGCFCSFLFAWIQAFLDSFCKCMIIILLSALFLLLSGFCSEFRNSESF